MVPARAGSNNSHFLTSSLLIFKIVGVALPVFGLRLFARVGRRMRFAFLPRHDFHSLQNEFFQHPCLPPFFIGS